MRNPDLPGRGQLENAIEKAGQRPGFFYVKERKNIEGRKRAVVKERSRNLNW
jgi:hypothetical protein